MKIAAASGLTKILVPVAVVAAGVGGYMAVTGRFAGTTPAATAVETIPLTIASANGAHVFIVELAKTAAAQEAGLMYRTDLKPNGGMLFWPYPPDGGAPRLATFWMKNTPSALDIVFLRADHSIAHIAENAVPFSEAQIPSVEPAAAVLEIPGGRAADLGIAEGDKVSWPGMK